VKWTLLYRVWRTHPLTRIQDVFGVYDNAKLAMETATDLVSYGWLYVLVQVVPQV
jgi:hypothetical protein